MIHIEWQKKHRLDGLIKGLSKMDKEYVEYGLFKESGLHPDNPHLTYASLMAIHELREDSDPMKRPVFQKTLDKHGSDFQDYYMDQFQDYTESWALARPRSPDVVLSRVGAKGVEYTQNTFGDTATLRDNAPSVIERKGKNSPLIDSGYLRNAVSFKTSTGNVVR